MHAGGAAGPPPQTGARALPLLPPLPRAGGGVGGNQSWLTVPLGHTIPGQKGQSTATGCAILCQVA